VTLIQPGSFLTNIQSHFASSYAELEESGKKLDAAAWEKYKESVPPMLKFVTSGNDPAPFNKLPMVADAYVNALLARFPPAKRLVGYDAYVIAYMAWALPDSVTDVVTGLSNLIMARQVK